MKKPVEAITQIIRCHEVHDESHESSMQLQDFKATEEMDFLTFESPKLFSLSSSLSCYFFAKCKVDPYTSSQSSIFFIKSRRFHAVGLLSRPVDSASKTREEESDLHFLREEKMQVFEKKMMLNEYQ